MLHCAAFEYNEMNRRLEIDISSEIEQQSPPYRQPPEEEHEQEEEDEEDEEEEEEYASDEFEASERIEHGNMSRPGIFESAETFGNQQPNSSDHRFLDRLLHSRPNSLQEETPIGIRPTDRREHSIDDEIARIISKVNRSQGARSNHEAETRSRIGIVNKQLLKENTGLIEEINQLQSKLEAVAIPKQKKKGREGEPLTGKLQSYRQKLSRALALNSKLSARLATERSRSNAISSTFRSILNQPSSHLTLRTHNRADSAEIKHSKKSANSKLEAYCPRCCREVEEREGASGRSKELILSPVLQYKNYEIAAEKSSEFEMARKLTRQVHCQVNFQEMNAIEKLRAMEEEEKQLQTAIQANNRAILQFEEMLYQLVEG